MTVDRPGWMEQFQIQSEVDLDFVIGQGGGLPVGMTSRSPAEFKRRVLAAMISYTMQLKSIDCTLKQYVDHDLYETEDESLGETISHYLRAAAANLTRELRQLHTQGELPFGILGAELTLFRLPHALDTARILSNRGLLLEVLPLLRLCLEMIAWAHSAFYISDEAAVVELRATKLHFVIEKDVQIGGQDLWSSLAVHSLGPRGSSRVHSSGGRDHFSSECIRPLSCDIARALFVGAGCFG